MASAAQMHFPTTLPVGEMQVLPHQQSHMSLGVFTSEKPPVGFEIEISPNSLPAESVTTKIETLGSKKYTLTLYVDNSSDEPVSAKVAQLQAFRV